MNESVLAAGSLETATVVATKRHNLAWFVWGLGAAYFFCDYFARVSTGVMVHQLMTEFHVTALGIGTLSSFFYYPYVAMQIPVGLLVDRFGVRRILTCMALLTGFSCFVFGSAQHLAMAQFGRALLGFGAAFAFVSALKIASVWFPPSRFGLLAGLTQALGMLGAAVGEAPVAYSVAEIGWRHTMFVMTGAFIVLATMIAIVVRDRPDNVADAQTQIVNKTSAMTSLKQVLSNPQSWYNAIYAGLLFAPTAVFAELWGPSYLVHVQGLTEAAAATGNGMIFLGWGLGGPILGWLSDRFSLRRPAMIASALIGCALMSIIIYTPHLSTLAIFTLLFLFGVSNAGVGVSYAVAAEINPRQISGASMAFANMMSVIIGAGLQPVVGALIDWHAGDRIVNGVANFTASDFRTAMVLLPACLLLSFVMVFFIRETHCKPVDK